MDRFSLAVAQKYLDWQHNSREQGSNLALVMMWVFHTPSPKKQTAKLGRTQQQITSANTEGVGLQDQARTDSLTQQVLLQRVSAQVFGVCTMYTQLSVLKRV